jgi:hypothetical protein
VTCEYDTPEGLTARKAQQRQFEDFRQSTETLQSALEVLRSGSEEDATAALMRIRTAEDVNEAVAMIDAAQALVQTRVQVHDARPGIKPQTANRMLRDPLRASLSLEVEMS